MYALMLAAVVAMTLATTAATPVISTVVQREKEAELEFRLRQYREAIKRYRADHDRYPQRLEDLLLDTTVLQRRRYLRRLYQDPMTGRVDWRLVIGAPTDASSGIEDLHSRSTATALRVTPGKTTYGDW